MARSKPVRELLPVAVSALLRIHPVRFDGEGILDRMDRYD